ncbi:MAG: (2Fe-2S)-binding protein [Planctomycetes bacterium]|nr:(2Fe-2S)-binding protein [Planctomycetota bacterium]
MESPCTSNGCGDCTERYACHCLGITADQVIQAVTTLGLRTLDELRQQTGAGAGCTACHRRLRLLIHRHAQSSSASPICSVR